MQVVMDIGGTNCRIATLDENHNLKALESWSCLDFSGPAEVFSSYIEKHQLEVMSLCMAIASPLVEDRVTMTNLNWSFSGKELKQQLSLKTLNIINDFHAVALAIPLLGNTEKIQLGAGNIDPDKPALICGPGTGLGVAILSRRGNLWQVLPGEGGHMDFAPNTPYEQEIWRIFHRQYGHVSCERILSGPGLAELHAAVCEIDGVDAEILSGDQVSGLALAGKSASCEKTLHLFCAMLGSFCGSLALTSAAFGGVYIGGGIVPRFIDFLNNSEFRDRFEAKGRYRSYNEKIPTFVITAEYPGLLGAAAFLKKRK
jgi:glucokinase